MTGRRGPAEEGSKWAGYRAIGLYVLVLAATTAVTVALLPRAEAYGGAQAANAVVGAGINLFLISVVALGFTKTIDTMFLAKDLERMESQPLSGATLYLYGLPKTISYIVYATGRVLLGVLLGYGYYVVFGGGSSPQAGGILSIVGGAFLYIALMLLCCLSILLICTSSQALLGCVVLSVVPARFRQQGLLVTALALFAVGGALYRLFVENPPEVSVLQQRFTDIAETEDPLVLFRQFGSLVAAIFGPLLTSPAWSAPPGGWAAMVLALPSAAQTIPASESIAGLWRLGILASGLALLGFVIGSPLYYLALKHMEPESSQTARSEVPTAAEESTGSESTEAASTSSRSSAGAGLVSRLTALANRLPLVNAGAVRSACVCEFLSMLRTQSRIWGIAAVLAGVPALVSFMLVSVPQLNPVFADPSTGSVIESARNGTAGANAVLLLVYGIVALIAGVTPFGLAHSSVGLEGNRYESWAVSAVSPSEFLRGKVMAHIVLACGLGLILIGVTFVLVGPFYRTGLLVFLIVCLPVSIMASVIEIGVSARNARFEWDHPQHATSRWAILTRIWIGIRLVLRTGLVAIVVVTAIVVGFPIVPTVIAGTLVVGALIIDLFRRVLREGQRALENVDW